MISSMTAFARQERQGEWGSLVWELRSVNHRYLEIFMRLSEEMRSLEPVIRERVTKRLARGKLDCALRFKPSATLQAELAVDGKRVEQLLAAGAEVARLLDSGAGLSPIDVLRWPGVLEEREMDFTPVQIEAQVLLEEALDSLIETRCAEGRRLGANVAQRCVALRGLVGEARRLMPLVLETVRTRIRTRLGEVLEELDENRLEQEMALLAQRLDVDEEMDRLDAHLDEVEQVLKRTEPIGRRLDFLMQELNREANTLSSKSNDVEITRIAVEMKVLIEQMREQIQNIE